MANPPLSNEDWSVWTVFEQYGTNCFFFGSAIRAITADPSVSISPDFSAIDNYLTRQYVPSPVTAFAGIFKLWNKSSGNGQFQSPFSGENDTKHVCSTG